MNAYAMPVEGNDWEQWRARMWNTLAEQFGHHPGIVALEQYTMRSRREKRCVDCGEPGTVRQESVLIKSVPHYWFCADCDTYWRNK